MKTDKKQYTRKEFMKNMGGALAAGGLMAGVGFPFKAQAEDTEKVDDSASKMHHHSADAAKLPVFDRIAADPSDIPPPIKRRKPKTHHLQLTSMEAVAEVEEGVQHRYLTFGGQVPGPVLRVRQGDTIYLTHKASPNNIMVHNIDLHAVYGSHGGGMATYAAPGQSQTIKFKAMYPGAFIYHCAVPQVAYHISGGMYGMIIVEPKEGLPPVDHEFYLGQNELYSEKITADLSQSAYDIAFDFKRMMAENPTYVFLNGEKYALTKGRYGPMKVKKGETARIFFVNGGPNLTSHFHPIGNVWTKVWREGAFASEPEKYVQTVAVPPGSCAVLEIDFPVPETINLVDHALSRVTQKGMKGQIKVAGAPEPDIFDPNPKL